MPRVFIWVLLALLLCASALAAGGSASDPIISAVNASDPWDNAGAPVSDALCFRSEGANLVYVDRGPWSDELVFYVAGPDGQGFFAHPVTDRIPRLGLGEYWLAASIGGAYRVPGQPAHFDFGPVRVRFRKWGGGSRYWSLLGLPPP